ncbi:MAG TPA: hypothetical protein VMD07_10270 [Candidatus Acidoferrales bacterium]|nr:hypothetical protein [Candidatus Acidoferrales bacterium]
MKRPFLGFALALGALAFAAPAVAQADPIVVAQPVVVAQQAGSPFVGRHELRGTVTYFNAFTMDVRAAREVVPVHLHQGTIINPRGLTLHPGMYVRVFGFWANGNFQADRIGLIY